MTGFYKLEDGVIAKVEYKIFTPNGEYVVANHADYDFPILDRWYYFTDDLSAENYFNSKVGVPRVNGVPISITRMQALLTLDGMDLLDTVETMMNHANTPKTTKIAYQNALEFKRNSPLVIGMAQALRLTDAQLDQLFIAGSEVNV
jgi:hypothetical protein